MRCTDNSKLQKPLSEECEITPIGCIQPSKGEPSWTPEEDQLPLAYDTEDKTLWMYDCEKSEWVNLSRFKLCDLNEVSLANLGNLCNILRIPVMYNLATGCNEGYVSLSELAEQVKACADFDDDISAFYITPINEDRFDITIEEPSKEGLDPVRHTISFKTENIDVTGSGTSSDPLVLTAITQDICTYEVATQETVDKATTPLLAACVDKKPCLIPIPADNDTMVCDYLTMTDPQIDEADCIKVAVCADGTNGLVDMKRVAEKTVPEIDSLDPGSNPPESGKLPFKVGPCGTLFVWTEQKHWVRVRHTPIGLKDSELDCYTDPVVVPDSNLK